MPELSQNVPSRRAMRNAIKALNRQRTELQQEALKMAKMAKDAPSADLDAAWLEKANALASRAGRLASVVDWIVAADMKAGPRQ